MDPVGTAADKLSAFAWRMIVRDRSAPDDDPTIVRHLHDLAALETTAAAASNFPPLLAETLVADTHRGGGAVAHLQPADRLAAMLAKLDADTAYRNEYARFVGGMAFAGEADVPTYDDAIAALSRLTARLA